MILTRGMRDKLSKYVDVTAKITVDLAICGGSIYDFCCFGVDQNGKLSDDRYMIFYNQTVSPEREISFQPGNASARFILHLTDLPHTIEKLVFTATIDGNGIMSDITSHTFSLSQNGREQLSMQLAGSEFRSEKAIISVEIYRKGEWRIAAVANGFNGGLSALLAYFGGTELHASETPAPSAPQTPTTPPMPAASTSMPQTPPMPSPNPVPPQMPTAPVGMPQTQPIPAPPIGMPQTPVIQPQTDQPPVVPQKISLKKGQKISLAKNNNKPIIIENGWSAKGKDYDLKALVRYRDGRLIYVGAANLDEVLSTPEGAIWHDGDVKHPGELEHITITWHPDIASVAVSSYSAIENGTGSFYRYGVYVRIINGNQIVEIPAANTSADERSYTLCFGEILFGDTPGSFEVSALEMYSRSNSENRIGYQGTTVVMDIGPRGQTKA